MSVTVVGGNERSEKETIPNVIISNASGPVRSRCRLQVLLIFGFGFGNMGTLRGDHWAFSTSSFSLSRKISLFCDTPHSLSVVGIKKCRRCRLEGV